MSPIGTLSLPFRKRQAQHIDNENIKMMQRIINVNPDFSCKKLEVDFTQQKKYKKMLKKGTKKGFDFDKIQDHQKKIYAHIESKTSSQLFPPIGSSKNRSRSQI